MGHRHDTHPGVPAGGAVGGELFEMADAQGDAGLDRQRAQRGGFGVLVGGDEGAGQR